MSSHAILPACSTLSVGEVLVEALCGAVLIVLSWCCVVCTREADGVVAGLAVRLGVIIEKATVVSSDCLMVTGSE